MLAARSERCEFSEVNALHLGRKVIGDDIGLTISKRARELHAMRWASPRGFDDGGLD